MSKIIALANQKGGVAKTTTTHNVGVALASKGKRVLMVDLDSQASLTISTGLEPLDIENNVASLLGTHKIHVKDCIQPLNDNLHIITSIIDLAQLEMEMVSRISKEKILDRALEPVKAEYDYILIDCPPQLGILTMNALSCADGVIVPTKTDYLAYRGLSQLMNTVQDIKELINPRLEVLGVIATMFETRVTDDVAILDMLKENYNLIGVVKKLAIAKKGLLQGLSAIEQTPSNEVAEEYMKISEMIINERYESEVC